MTLWVRVNRLQAVVVILAILVVMLGIAVALVYISDYTQIPLTVPHSVSPPPSPDVFDSPDLEENVLWQT